MTTYVLVTKATLVAAFSMMFFGWGTVMFPAGMFTLLAWAILWGLGKTMFDEQDDGLPHSFGERFDETAEAMRYDIDDTEARQPSAKAIWPNGIGGYE